MTPTIIQDLKDCASTMRLMAGGSLSEQVARGCLDRALATLKTADIDFAQPSVETMIAPPLHHVSADQAGELLVKSFELFKLISDYVPDESLYARRPTDNIAEIFEAWYALRRMYVDLGATEDTAKTFSSDLVVKVSSDPDWHDGMICSTVGAMTSCVYDASDIADPATNADYDVLRMTLTEIAEEKIELTSSAEDIRHYQLRMLEERAKHIVAAAAALWHADHPEVSLNSCIDQEEAFFEDQLRRAA